MRTLIVAGLALAVAGAAAAATPAQTCAAAKLKAARQKHQAKIKCHERAVLRGVAVDSGCLLKAEVKFRDAFLKAEQKGGCITVGDGDAVEATVDSCVSALIAQLPSTPSSTTTSTTVPAGPCTAILAPCSPGCNGHGECQAGPDNGALVCVDLSTRRNIECITLGCEPDEVCALRFPSINASACYHLCPD